MSAPGDYKSPPLGSVVAATSVVVNTATAPASTGEQFLTFARALNERRSKIAEVTTPKRQLIVYQKPLELSGRMIMSDIRKELNPNAEPKEQEELDAESLIGADVYHPRRRSDFLLLLVEIDEAMSRLKIQFTQLLARAQRLLTHGRVFSPTETVMLAGVVETCKKCIDKLDGLYPRDWRPASLNYMNANVKLFRSQLDALDPPVAPVARKRGTPKPFSGFVL